MSRDFELGRNLSGDFRKSLTYLLLLVIWVCLSDILLTITTQAVSSRNTSTCHVTNGRASVGVNAGAGEGFSHVNARPQTVGRTKKLF